VDLISDLGNGHVSMEVKPGVPKPSIREIFEPAKLSLERAPVLRDVFDRFTGVCADQIKLLCAPPCTFMLNSIASGALWDLIEDYEDGICGIYYSPEWDTRILIGFDRRFAFSFTEAVFGGDGTEAPLESDRPFSTIETRSLKELVGIAASALAPLLSMIDKVTLQFERIETKLDFSTIGIPDGPAIMPQIIAQVYDGGGRIFIIVPQSALLPLRRNLERDRTPKPVQQDPVWGQQLMNEISMADVQIDAVLPGPTLTLAQLSAFRVGDVMRLPGSIDSLLLLESAGEPVFCARLGQSAGQFTVQIAHPSDQRRELFQDLALGRNIEGARE